MAGDSPGAEPRPSAVFTLRRLLSTSFGRFRSLSKSVRSSSERVVTDRRVVGNLVQFAGVATTAVGVFVLFGLGVGLVVTGLVTIGIGAMHERGLI